MKLNTTDFLRKAQHPLQLAFVSIPPAMLLALSNAPEALPRLWALPAAYVLLAWGCILLPGKRRLGAGILSAVLLLALAWVLLPLGKRLLLLLLPVMYIGLLGPALPIGGWPRNRELHAAWHIVGVVFHLLMQFVVSTKQRMAVSAYDAAQTPLTVSFLCCAALALLALNRASLDSAAQSRRTVPLLMQRQNRVLTILLMAAGVALAALPAVKKALEALWDLLRQGIIRLAAWLASLMPDMGTSSGGSGGSGQMELGFGEVNEPSQLAIILEKVIMGIALLVLLIALVLAGRVIVKKLRVLLRALWARLTQYGAAAGEDYVDEITSTRDEPDTEREGVLSRLRRRMPLQDKAQTPTEQVRRRYRWLQQKHSGWSKASTARENLPASAARLYERARYSGQELSAEEAERFHAGTKKV